MLQRRTDWKKQILSVALALLMLLGSTPQPVLAAAGEILSVSAVPLGAAAGSSAENPFAGKTLSILGDSISTYTGVSNNTSYNSTIGKNSIYYSAGALGGQQHTWWQQTIDALGMRLLVNNSWSGSAVLKPRQGAGSEGYLSRCVNLHNDKTGETPDVIAVFLGTNDFSYHQSTLGTADIAYATLITPQSNGSFVYATPKTTCEAYAIMLHKMQQRYPDAEIFCMTLLPRREPDHDGKDVVPAPTVFNGELAKVIAHFGCTLVDLEHCGITSQPENFDYYISDKRVHPGAAGMDKMSEALISAMLGKTITLQNVTAQYAGASSDNSAAVALRGSAYTANLTAQPGYGDLRVTVTMGGEDVTADCYQNGQIHIPSVTGDIAITAAAVKQATNYRWEFDGSDVTSVTENNNRANALTKQGGSLTDGVLQSAYFQMAEAVALYHHRPWVVEWSAAGNWSGMLLSKQQSSTTEGNEYFFKSNSVSIGLIAFGHRQDGQYLNYGIRLADHGVDPAARHIYRLENRIAKDGSNAVHLLVDGVDYGAMTRHYISTNDQGSNANWANGHDLTFGYIGTNGHAMNGCDLDYLQIWEAGDAHTHTYQNGTCASCGKDMLRIEKTDLVQYQGGVNSLNGTLNTTFTNNWYSDIRIPKGAQQVRYLTFKTGGDWGVAFLQEGTYLSGACDKIVGGQWVTADVPADATVFRYGYLYDAIAAQKGLPAFAYVEFIGDELEQWEQSNYLPRPATGCHSFSVEVNIAPAQGNPDGYVKGTDYGYIQLPTNYSPYGAPTRLIIVCHGAGASLSTYKSSAWKNTNYSFWTDLGYAVMDMYASPQELTGSTSELHYGNPVVLECYKKGYDYVMQHFNLKQDGIFLIGASMGGLSSFQIAQSGQFPVIAQVAYCPVIDLFKQAYCNPWTTASYQRSRIASYFGFAGTAPAFTNSRYPSVQEIEFFRQNADKITTYSPILRNVIDGDITALFHIIPTSPTATSAEEAALYAGLTATHPNPLLVFHNTDDGTVAYRYSQYFVEMVNRSGQEAVLRTFTSGNHNAWANGENKTVQGINGSITIKESQYEAYLFFDKFERHESHCAWTDPAKAPTCNASGLTEGSHCAVCGEVLKKQKPVPAKGHSFTRYISDGNATLYADGTKTALCDRGCGAKDTVADVGSMLLPEQVTSQIYPIAGAFLTGAPAGTTVQTLLSGLDWGTYCTVFDADGCAVAADAAVGTGMVLKLQPKGQTKQTLVIVVAGDLSGDGAVTETDLAQMQNHLLQVQLLAGAFAKAADCSGDGIVSVTDIIRLQALLLQKA